MSITGFDPGAGGPRREEEEKRQPTFDEIVAQTLTDQKFIEENTQLPGDVGVPAPAPPPPAPPPPAPLPQAEQQFIEDNTFLPGADLFYGAPPVADTKPLSLADILLQEQNIFLPNQGAPDPFMEWAYNESPLAQQIKSASIDLADTKAALGSLIPVESLLDMTPERLDQLEEYSRQTNSGFDIGPLAGLNHEIARKNQRFNEVATEIEHMMAASEVQGDTRFFNTQAEVDRFNALLNEYTQLGSELDGLINRYVEEAEALIERQGEAIDTLYGDDGLLRQFNKLYGPGGLAQQAAVMGEGLVGAATEPDATPAMDPQLYNMLRAGLVTMTSLKEAQGGTAYKLTEAGEQAIAKSLREQRQAENYNRRQREIWTLGATSEMFGQFRDDPGFQEFASQLTTMDASPELLEELQEQLGISQVAARTNPYGEGKPVPLQTALLDVGSEYRGATQLSTGESLLTLLGAPFAPLMGIPGIEAIDIPGRAANISILGYGQSAWRTLEMGGETLRQFVSPGHTRARQMTGEGPTALVPTTISPEGFQYVSPVANIQDVRRKYESLPWFITLTGEIIFDPLNLFGVGEVKNVFRAIRLSGDVSKIRGATSLAYEQALRGGTRADTAYLKAHSEIAGTTLSKIDSFKLATTQDRFTTVAQQALGVNLDSAKIFGNRLTYRLHVSPEQQWGNILNEELGRLAESTGRVIDAETAARFNRELGQQQAFSLLSGNEFWESIGGEFPKVIQDTPQWRRARERELPNPDDVWDLRTGETPAIDNLVAVGYGPDVAVDERWGDFAAADGASRVIPAHNYRADYLTPQNTPVATPDAVSDDMMRVLERQYERAGKTLETRPTNLDEYWQAWRDLISKPGKNFAPAHTPDDVIRDPRYQVLYANKIGDLSEGVVSKWADDPIAIHELGDLIQASFIQGRDLLADLLAIDGVGAPASHTRFRWIFDNMPATEWQKAQIKKFAKQQKKTIPESTLENLKWDEARDWINMFRRQKNGRPRDIRSVGMDYVTDLDVVAKFDKEQLFRMELRALIADLLTPSGGGRYTFTRPVKRPNGTTANGWARLSEWELIQALEKAPEKILRLPTYGPLVSEIAETARRMRGLRSGARQIDLAMYPTLLGDVRGKIDSLIDEVTEIASPAETYEFKNWLVSLYDKSYLPRPGKAANPRDYLPDNPNMVDLDKALSELAVRQAERAMIQDAQARYRAVAELTAWEEGGQTSKLDWRRLAEMDNELAKLEIRKHFDNPNSPMTLDGFYDLMRQVHFIEPGGAPITLNDILRDVRQLREAHRTVTQEIVEWGGRADEIAAKVGVDDISSLKNLSPEPNITDYMRQFEDRIPEYAQYDPNYSMPLTTPENRALALKESTQEVTYAARNSTRPAWHHTPPVMEPKIFEGRGSYVSKGEWDGPELNRRLQVAFANFNSASANNLTVDQIVSKVISPNVYFAKDDLVTQAMLVRAYSVDEIARAAGISKASADRLRRAISREVTASAGVTAKQVGESARAMREAINLAEAFYAAVGEKPSRIRGLKHSKIELVGGKLKVPDGMVRPLIDWLDETYGLSDLHRRASDEASSAKVHAQGAPAPEPRPQAAPVRASDEASSARVHAQGAPAPEPRPQAAPVQRVRPDQSRIQEIATELDATPKRGGPQEWDLNKAIRKLDDNEAAAVYLSWAEGSADVSPRVAIAVRKHLQNKGILPAVEDRRTLLEHIRSYFADQQKLGIVWQPGAGTKMAANVTREVLGTVLDYFVFGVTDRQTAHQIMTVFGPAGSRYIRPQHQRPVVPVFDPFTVQLGKINWKIHGKAYDDIIHAYHELDPVWGYSVTKRLDPRNMRELTKMSKGITIGDNTSFIAHVVYANIKEIAERSRENITDIYSEILNEMDAIVDGGPAAQMRYGEMFSSSEEMGRWLKWARARQDDGQRNWDIIKERWGDLTPHLSVSRMPQPLFDAIFRPMREGVGIRKQGLNRAPVLEDAKRLDDFVRGNLDLDELGLTADQRIEAELWRDALSQNWDNISQQLRDGIDGQFRKGVHVDDLDALFQLDHLDPYDAQRFADNLGTLATELEYRRLGYNPDKIALLLKITQYIKATFGYVWLRAAPRYIINNIFGNMVSIILNQLRSDRAGGVRINRRVLDAMNNKTSALHRHRMMGQGIATTEFTRDGIRGVVTRRLTQEEAKKVREQAQKDLFTDPQRGRLRRAGDFLSLVGRPIKAYTDFNARATDFFELDARSRVWTNEFDYSFRTMWEQGLDSIDGLDPALRDQLAEQLELADIARIARDGGLSEMERAQVFRAYNTSLTHAHLRAYHATKSVMRDYLIRNRFDNMLDQIFPYHYWMTKNLMFVTGTVMDRPATVLQGSRIYDTWQQQWEGLPYSFRNKIHIANVPSFVWGLGGKEIAIRPNNITNPAFLILPAVVEEMRDAWNRYEDMPIFERLARTMAGGGKKAWEEVGYSAGPHMDAVVGVLTSNKVDEWARQITPEDMAFWKDHFDNALNLVVRPQGFEQEILPLGGLEDAILWGVGGTKAEVVRRVYADMNRLTKGSDFTAGEINQMGFILYEMALNEEITEEQFGEIQQLIVGGRYTEIDANPVGAQVLDRMYKRAGEKAAWNYGTALSFTEYYPAWKEATQANNTYQMLKRVDDMIPYPAGATPEQKKQVDALNKRIEGLHQDTNRYLEVHNFSPDAIAQSTDNFNVELFKLYREAQAAGIDVPQLRGEGPNLANEWAFGKRNPQTGEREGGAAPWLAIYWRANDNQADIDARAARDAEWERTQQRIEAGQQARLERDERRGAAAPYWNQIDDIRADERRRLNELYSRGLSENAERRLEDQILDDTRKRIGAVYDAAEQAGVSLRGFGRIPNQTPAWYDLSDSANGDIRYIYEQLGLGVPRDRELLSLDEAIALNKVKDTIEAHTTWAMREVVDVLDLNPYLPNGEPNPRFMRDGHFDRGLWEQTVKREAPHILNTYTELLKTYRDASRQDIRDGERFIQDMLARPITFEEFFEFATTDVLPRQSAYDMAMSAALDRVFSMPGQVRDVLNVPRDQLSEKEQLVLDGIREFGPKFGDIARGNQIKVDMDQVATTISNFYNGLRGAEKQTFEEQWGHLIVDGGDVRVIDPEALGYRDAVLIADKYGLEIPTYESEFQLSRNRQALKDAWGQLSKSQQAEFKEVWSKDETLPDEFVLTISGADEETGEPYDFTVANFDMLNATQVAKLIKQMGAPVDPYFPDPEEEKGTINPRTPKFQRLLAEAARQKEQEVVTEAFHSGEAFLSDPKDVEGWQRVQALKEQYPDLYEAGREIIEKNGVSWQWLVDNLADTPKAAGDNTLTLKEFAEMFVFTMEDVEYSRLLNERRKWLRGEGSQYTELVVQYLDDRDPLVEDAMAQAEAGTLYGFEGEDLANWQEFYAYEDAHPALHQAALVAKEKTGMTWQELYDSLEDREPGSEGGMTLKEYIGGRLQRIKDYDMGRLWDQRSAFFTTEYGQSLVVRDPERLAGYLPDDAAGGGSSRPAGGGSSRRASGGRSFGTSGGSQRRPSSSTGRVMNDYSSGIREIFRLDTGMLTGNVPDAQARYDVSLQVADLIEKKVQWAATIFGETSQIYQLLIMGWTLAIKQILGENPTLELWMEVLRRLGGGEAPPEPSQELLENPDLEENLAAD